MRVARALLGAALVLGAAQGAHGQGRPPEPVLLAGAHAVDVTPAAGVPLAGYGGFPRRLPVPDLLGRHPWAFWFKPSLGVRDPIMARALVLESGGRRALWVTVDLVGPDGEMLAELKARLAAGGLRYDAVVLAASHTHSGPGAYARSRLFAFLALDRFVAPVREKILAGMAEAAARADAARAPARVGAGRGTVEGIATSRVGLPLDPEVGVLKVVRPDGRPVAVLWNYAIHPTALGRGNLHLSGDLTGLASHALERRLQAPALFVNGAVGDVSPALRGETGARAAAEALAREVLLVWERTPATAGAGLRVATLPLVLPAPRLSLRNCLGRWLPRGWSLGLGRALPREAELVGVAVGSSAWVTIPGELQTRLGEAVKAAGRRRFAHAFVVGVANAYAGYFLEPAAYHRPGYIACASLYGEGGGTLVAARARELLERLGEEGGG
jgi:neutral ceramidase